MAVVLAVAPHPDDETLGCGGALLRHVAEGDSVHWLIVTSISENEGYSPERVAARASEIEAVAKAYGMAAVHSLGFPTTRLDEIPVARLVGSLSRVVGEVRPETVYVPHPGDVHSDHRRVFEACAASSKWFRQPSLRELLCYETLSETGLQVRSGAPDFRPSLHVDIARFVERKVAILELYRGEVAAFPFPRSAGAVRALAAHRGAQSGFEAAEAFEPVAMRR